MAKAKRKRKRAKRRSNPSHSAPPKRRRRARARPRQRARRRNPHRHAMVHRRRRRRRNPSDSVGGMLLASAAGIVAGLVTDIGVGVVKAQVTSLPTWAPAVIKGIVGAGGAALLYKHPTYAVGFGVGVVTPAVIAVVRPMVAAHITLGDTASNYQGRGGGASRFTLSQSEMRAIQALVQQSPSNLSAIQAIEAAVDQAANAAAAMGPTVPGDDGDDSDAADYGDGSDDDFQDLDSDLDNWDELDFQDLVDANL